MYKFVLLILLLSLSLPAAARMYQWVDSESGTTQLSGKPPVWYRSGQGGPRVFVFEKGRVVDDTGIEVTEAERERLRQQALVKAEQDGEQVREKLLEAKRLKALVDKQRQASDEARAEQQVEEPVFIEPEELDEKPAPVSEQQQTTEEMRRLIQEWERLRMENARDVIDNGPSGTPAGAPEPD